MCNGFIHLARFCGRKSRPVTPAGFPPFHLPHGSRGIFHVSDLGRLRCRCKLATTSLKLCATITDSQCQMLIYYPKMRKLEVKRSPSCPPTVFHVWRCRSPPLATEVQQPDEQRAGEKSTTVQRKTCFRLECLFYCTVITNVLCLRGVLEDPS